MRIRLYIYKWKIKVNKKKAKKVRKRFFLQSDLMISWMKTTGTREEGKVVIRKNRSFLHDQWIQFERVRDSEQMQKKKKSSTIIIHRNREASWKQVKKVSTSDQSQKSVAKISENNIPSQLEARKLHQLKKSASEANLKCQEKQSF